MKNRGISISAICLFLSSVSLAGTAVGDAGGDSTINPEDRFAYAGNAGWINFRPDSAPGVVVSEYFLAGYAYGANIGWIHFGSGLPVNGWRYANDSGDDFGVNVGDFGNLSGYAWAANVGWIYFGWADPSDPARPRVDLHSGAFSGYAWSANIGWIKLGAGHLATDFLARPDSTGDGLPDAWKYRYFGSLDGAGAGLDYSGDGFPNWQYYLAGTDPTEGGPPLKIERIAFHREQQEGWLEVVFRSGPRRLYQIEASTDLKVWSAAGNSFASSEGSSTSTLIQLSTVAGDFFRVRPVQPLEM